MKEWFVNLQQGYQVLLIIISLAFVVTIIYASVDIEIAKSFINLTLKTVEGICKHLTSPNTY